MRRWSLFLGLLAVGIFPIGSARAVLSDSDPKNFFTQLNQAVVVVKAQRKSVEEPNPKQAFFLYQLKDLEVLKGPKDLDSLKVVEEVLTPRESGLLPESGEFLLTLAELPHFTSYQDLIRRGYAYRILGGKGGVFVSNAEALTLAKQYLQSESGLRYRVLLQALRGPDSRLANDGSGALVEIGRWNPSSEELDVLSTALQPGGLLTDKGQIAAVQALENCGTAVCLATLKQISENPSSAAKWAALRSLVRLGATTPVEKLADDFRAADDAGKTEALGLVLSQKNTAAAEFASSVLSGNFSDSVKKAAIQKMAENKAPEYEAILLKQVPQGEEAIRVESVLALGHMGSSQAVPLVIPLLDSPNKALRGAAFFMLTASMDPKAQEYMNDRYSRDHHGVWQQNQHFYDNIGPPRPQ